MSTLGRAIEIAATAHAGQTDKGGNPYILHPLWVMNRVKHLGTNVMIAAVLHDVVEDTDWTIEMLEEEMFNANIINALQLLDFRGTDYLARIKTIGYDNSIARHVKMADLEHNTSILRLKGIGDKDFERMKKYHKAYIYLRDSNNF